MEITDVKITLVDKGKLRAFATIVLDDCIAVHGLKVIQGQSGLFVAMPCPDACERRTSGRGPPHQQRDEEVDGVDHHR